MNTGTRGTKTCWLMSSSALLPVPHVILHLFPWKWKIFLQTLDNNVSFPNISPRMYIIILFIIIIFHQPAFLPLISCLIWSVALEGKFSRRNYQFYHDMGGRGWKSDQVTEKNFVLDNGFSHLFFGGKKIEPSLVHTGCGVPALKLPASWGCLVFHFSQVSSCTLFSAGLRVLEHWEPGLICLNMPHIQQRHARSKSNSCIYPSPHAMSHSRGDKWIVWCIILLSL